MSTCSSHAESFRNRAETEKNILMKNIENPDLAPDSLTQSQSPPPSP